MLRRIRRVFRAEGVRGVVRYAVAFVYREGLRPWLPAAGAYHYAGLPVAYPRKWGDARVPALWRPEHAEDVPSYEAALVGALRAYVQPGDRVVVVGGGVGVTAVVAAGQAGPEGQVVCFEGAREGVAKVRRTAALNGVADRVEVRHAVVGRAIAVYGAAPNEPVVDPAALPPCDVLELDCEGAEVDVLQALPYRPRVVLVETHGLHGAPTAAVAALLAERGYAVEDRGVAEPRVRAYCEAHDIRVLAGLLPQAA